MLRPLPISMSDSSLFAGAPLALKRMCWVLPCGPYPNSTNSPAELVLTQRSSMRYCCKRGAPLPSLAGPGRRLVAVRPVATRGPRSPTALAAGTLGISRRQSPAQIHGTHQRYALRALVLYLSVFELVARRLGYCLLVPRAKHGSSAT